MSTQNQTPIQPQNQPEPLDIRWLRFCLKRWPLPHGKGALMNLYRPFLRNRRFFMEVEAGITVPAELEDYILYWYFVHGIENDPAFRFSRSLLRPGDTILDIGANIGLWAMGAARQAGTTGAVHAFEPVPENFERLQRNLKLNGLNHVRCNRIALADHGGHTRFFMASNHNSGAGSLTQRDGVDRSVEVELRTLDDYCAQNGVDNVDFIKIDVEGAEMLVFRGGKQVLSVATAPAIMFEFSQSHTASFGFDFAAVRDLLHDYGYELFRFHEGELKAVAAAPEGSLEDLFALKSHHQQRVASALSK